MTPLVKRLMDALKARGIADPMTHLQDERLISDLCVTPDDIADCDATRAIAVITGEML